MRTVSCFWLLVALSCTTWVCRGQTVEDGEYVVDFADWPMNGVPFVSEDGQVYPSYEERATLVWAGMVCDFPPSHLSPSYSVSCFRSLLSARDRLQLSTLSSSSTLHPLWQTHLSGISLRWTNGTLIPQRSTTLTSTVLPVQRRRTKRSALTPFPTSFATGQSSSRTSTGGSMKPSH